MTRTDNAAEQRDFAEAAGLPFASRVLEGMAAPEDVKAWAEKWAKNIVEDVEISATAFEGVEEMPVLWKLREQVREGIKSLRLFEDLITEWLIALAGNAWEFDIEGVGPVCRFKGTKRTKWDHDLVFSDLYRLALETPKGDLPPEERVLEAIRGAAGIGYWRSTALRKWGMDPDEYSETSPGKPCIEVKR